MIYNQLTPIEQNEAYKKYKLAESFSEKLEIIAEFLFAVAPEGFVRCHYCKCLIIDGMQEKHVFNCPEVTNERT